MKYTVNQYALALYGAIKENPNSRKQILERFYRSLFKDKKTGLVDQILSKTEKLSRKDSKINKVVIESVDGVSEETKKEIMQIFGKNTIIIDKRNPTVLGGIKFLINEEVLIDATLKKQADKLFNI